jgi:hypothetical protein
MYREFTVADLVRLMNGNPVLTDVKGMYNGNELEIAGVRVWRL